MQKQTAKGEKPITHGIEAGKGHVFGADHQGNKIIGEADERRHYHQKDHGCSMHGEELIITVRGQKVIVGPGQLQAHDQSFQTADGEKEKGGQEIENADSFVIHRSDPAKKPIARFSGMKDFDGEVLVH
jgi:hypothetical protein